MSTAPAHAVTIDAVAAFNAQLAHAKIGALKLLQDLMASLTDPDASIGAALRELRLAATAILRAAPMKSDALAPQAAPPPSHSEEPPPPPPAPSNTAPTSTAPPHRAAPSPHCLRRSSPAALVRPISTVESGKGRPRADGRQRVRTLLRPLLATAPPNKLFMGYSD